MNKKKNNESYLICVNRKASFNYFIIDKYTAGIVLTGTEIKSIRARKVNINNSYCFFSNGELFVKQMHISPYKLCGYLNHDEYRIRKLLLNRIELIRLKNNLSSEKTIIPVELYISSKGYAKLVIALAKGKKLYDKRRALKMKDLERRVNEDLY